MLISELGVEPQIHAVHPRELVEMLLLHRAAGWCLCLTPGSPRTSRGFRAEIIGYRF